MSLCNIKSCSLHLTFLLLHAYTVCLCHCAFKHFWRHGRRLLWLAGLMPAAVEPWAEFFASSHISAPITEQSACLDSFLSAAASRAPIPLLPSSAVCLIPPLCHLLSSSASSACFMQRLLSLFQLCWLLRVFFFIYSVFFSLSTAVTF